MAIRNGTARKDKLTGTEASDTLTGLGAADVLRGSGGDDFLYGDAPELFAPNGPLEFGRPVQIPAGRIPRGRGGPRQRSGASPSGSRPPG